MYCFGLLMTHRLPAQAGESAPLLRKARPYPNLSTLHAPQGRSLRLVIHSFVFRGAFSWEVFLNTKKESPDHVKRGGLSFPRLLCYYRSIVLLVKQRKNWR